jgi:hypothetical protein
VEYTALSVCNVIGQFNAVNVGHAGGRIDVVVIVTGYQLHGWHLIPSS